MNIYNIWYMQRKFQSKKNQSLIIIYMNGAFIYFFKKFLFVFFSCYWHEPKQQTKKLLLLYQGTYQGFIHLFNIFFFWLTKTDKTKRNEKITVKRKSSNIVCIYHILSQIYNTHTECLSSLNSCFSFVRLLVRFGSFMSITIIHPSSSTFHIDIFI